MVNTSIRYAPEKITLCATPLRDGQITFLLYNTVNTPSRTKSFIFFLVLLKEKVKRINKSLLYVNLKKENVIEFKEVESFSCYVYQQSVKDAAHVCGL